LLTAALVAATGALLAPRVDALVGLIIGGIAAVPIALHYGAIIGLSDDWPIGLAVSVAVTIAGYVIGVQARRIVDRTAGDLRHAPDIRAR
jgi:hypothetical protein